jgi:hypothetical protein
MIEKPRILIILPGSFIYSGGAAFRFQHSRAVYRLNSPFDELFNKSLNYIAAKIKPILDKKLLIHSFHMKKLLPATAAPLASGSIGFTIALILN